ncbi:YaaR family protein [Pectinatus sottacetonis]|uniref:YaaR family protein n=1 Tax=Pectinatus sottacetonis TaxID=1002795 RepID=UPI0018C59E60|nr:YaaR family protein [Pectinatus sottacetonis]
MIKIDSLNPKGQLFKPAENNRDVQVKEHTDDFSMELEHNQEDLSMEQLKKLFDKVSEQGEKLTKTPTYDELRSYRDVVKQFIGEAVTRMYSMRSQSGWDRLGRQKIYTTVRKVDSKLEEMAEEIRLGQASALTIAAKHEAIRGMLVDLYM